MTSKLRAALAEVADMKYPSVAEILRNNRYGYEAGKVAALVAAFEEEVKGDIDAVAG